MARPHFATKLRGKYRNFAADINKRRALWKIITTDMGMPMSTITTMSMAG